MKLTYKQDMDEVIARFDAWWRFEKTDGPLMLVNAKKEPKHVLEPIGFTGNPARERRINPAVVDRIAHMQCEDTEFMADSFPCVSLDYGPGAMSAFLGCEPVFAPASVWYKPCIKDASELYNIKTRFDSEWFLKCAAGYEELRRLSGGDCVVAIPDLIDSLDTIAAMMGPQNLLYALIDNPEAVHAGSDLLDDIYFDYYERFRNITCEDDGTMSVQAFNILGKRVAKLQCDFSAMISPEMFNEFVAPSLSKYCARLDHALYHIDGEGEMRHVDTMLGIKGLGAFQWIPQIPGTKFTDEKYWPMFDKIHGAGKGLYLFINKGGPSDWAEETRRLTKRYGTRGMYYLYPEFPDVKTAAEFIKEFRHS